MAVSDDSLRVTATVRLSQPVTRCVLRQQYAHTLIQEAVHLFCVDLEKKQSVVKNNLLVTKLVNK